LEKGKFVKILGWEGKQSAIKKISDAINSYKKQKEN